MSERATTKRWSAAIAFAVLLIAAAMTQFAAGQAGAGYMPPDVATATAITYPPNTTTTGMVLLSLHIDDYGKVQGTQVAQDIPPLTAAARASAAKWTFKPASVDGNTVSTEFPVAIVFNPYNPGGTSDAGNMLTVPPAVPSIAAAGTGFLVPQIRSATYAQYPPNSVVSGTVVLVVSLDNSAHITKVRVVEGKGVLSDAAVATVKQWGFQPAMFGGQAVAGKICVAFVFQTNLS